MAKNRAYHKSNKQIREERKRAQRKAFVEKNKKQLIIAGIAAVIALVLLIIALDYFVTPGGSLRMFMGKLEEVPQNMVVRELNGHYFEFATMDAPEGYRAEEFASSFTSDDREQLLYFVTDDENRVINNVYVAGVKEKTGANMVAELTASVTASYYTSVSEPRNAQIGGHEVNYFYAHSPLGAGDGTEFGSLLVMYVDTVHDSSVLINCSTASFPDEASLPTEEAMLAEVDAILSHLKLPQ